MKRSASQMENILRTVKETIRKLGLRMTRTPCYCFDRRKGLDHMIHADLDQKS